MYNRSDHELFKVEPNFVHQNTAIYERPNLAKITFDVLVKKKHFYDVGIWSSMDMENTRMMVDKVFGRYLAQLLFVTYDQAGAAGGKALPLESRPLERNFSNIWSKFP